MIFKIGDKVRITTGVGYSITGIGSEGIVLENGVVSIYVEFYKCILQPKKTKFSMVMHKEYFELISDKYVFSLDEHATM